MDRQNLIRIVTYVMPWEMDEFDRMITTFARSRFYLNEDNKVIFDCVLNISDKTFDWKKSKLDKQFFIDKFNLIKLKCDWAHEVNFNIEENNKLLGCNDLRRSVLRNSSDDCGILWIDPDIQFPVHALKVMFDVYNQIKDEYFLVTPQTIKMWDESWDPIVNKQFIDKNFDFRLNYDFYHLDVLNESYRDKISIDTCNFIKFGGGLFTLYSSNLLKFIDIPDSFLSYGQDDTYMLFSCIEMKKANFNINQYLIENVVVSENYSMQNIDGTMDILKNPYDRLLVRRKTKAQIRHDNESNFNNEMTQMIGKIRNYG